MNAHILANYSARLRQPENVAKIQTIIRVVCLASTWPVRPSELMVRGEGPTRYRNARLRGQVGSLMLDEGFLIRDVAEVFSQHRTTTLHQIQTARKNPTVIL
jgi:hypothetical protein